MSERNRFEVIINAIKTGTPISNPRSRFEEIINAIVGAGGSEVEVTANYENGYTIGTISVDDVDTELKSPYIGVNTGTGESAVWTGSYKYNSNITDITFVPHKVYVFRFETDLNDGLKECFVTADLILTGTKFTIGAPWGQASNIWLQNTYDAETHTLTCNNGSAEVTAIYMLASQAEV